MAVRSQKEKSHSKAENTVENEEIQDPDEWGNSLRIVGKDSDKEGDDAGDLYEGPGELKTIGFSKRRDSPG